MFVFLSIVEFGFGLFLEWVMFLWELSEVELFLFWVLIFFLWWGSVILELGIKCVLVGDGVVGKSSFIVSYICNGYFVCYWFMVLDIFFGMFNGFGGCVVGGGLCICGLGFVLRCEGKEVFGEGGGSRF